MATVLITQCLQRDLVDPIDPHDPLPNLVRVGDPEATRLLGGEPAARPLAQVIQWGRGRPSDAIDLVQSATGTTRTTAVSRQASALRHQIKGPASAPAATERM